MTPVRFSWTAHLDLPPETAESAFSSWIRTRDKRYLPALLLRPTKNEAGAFREQVQVGWGPGVTVTDTITFQPAMGGTDVNYERVYNSVLLGRLTYPILVLAWLSLMRGWQRAFQKYLSDLYPRR